MNHIKCFITGEASVRAGQKSVKNQRKKIKNFDSIKATNQSKDNKSPSFQKWSVPCSSGVKSTM